MSINREAIYAALFERVRTVPSAVTVSRELKHIDNVAPEDMPYIAMVCKSQTRSATAGHLPGKYSLPCELFVYVARKGTDDVPSTLLNNILDEIDRALEAPHNHPAETLGQVPGVIHMRVEGEIQTDEGTLGEVAVAIVPIEIIAAG